MVIISACNIFEIKLNSYQTLLFFCEILYLECYYIHKSGNNKDNLILLYMFNTNHLN